MSVLKSKKKVQLTFYQHQMLPQHTHQMQRVLQIQKIISKYKEILRQAIKKASLLSQTYHHQWEKIFDEVAKIGIYYEQLSISFVREMHYMNLIDQGTINKLIISTHQLCNKYFRFQMYLLKVKQTIINRTLFGIYSGNNERIVWENIDIFFATDEKIQQRKNKALQNRDKVQQSIPDQEIAERKAKNYDG